MTSSPRHMASDQTLSNDPPHERSAIRMRREAEALENIVAREISARFHTERKQG